MKLKNADGQATALNYPTSHLMFLYHMVLYERIMFLLV